MPSPPDPVVGNGQAAAAAAVAVCVDDNTAACWREFDSVADELFEQIPEVALVAGNVWQSAFDIAFQAEAFFFRGHGAYRRDRFENDRDRVCSVSLVRGNFSAARMEFGEAETEHPPYSRRRCAGDKIAAIGGGPERDRH